MEKREDGGNDEHGGWGISHRLATNPLSGGRLRARRSSTRPQCVPLGRDMVPGRVGNLQGHGGGACYVMRLFRCPGGVSAGGGLGARIYVLGLQAEARSANVGACGGGKCWRSRMGGGDAADAADAVWRRGLRMKKSRYCVSGSSPPLFLALDLIL